MSMRRMEIVSLLLLLLSIASSVLSFKCPGSGAVVPFSRSVHRHSHRDRLVQPRVLSSQSLPHWRYTAGANHGKLSLSAIAVEGSQDNVIPAPVLSSPSPSLAAKSSSLQKSSFSVWTTVNLLLWYLFSSYYNIFNKRALTLLPLPWTIATLQMGTGILLFLPLWLFRLRPWPADSLLGFVSLCRSLSLVAAFTTLSHIAGVVSLGLGSVSFVQVVKAAEPLFTALISILYTKEFLPISAYLSMIPVILGVVLASLSELHFSAACLIAGILSNLFAGARGVLGKQQMTKQDAVQKEKTSISPENYYSVLTVISFFFCLPFLFFNEGKAVADLTQKALAGDVPLHVRQALENALLSGAVFYLYNELSFKVLADMNPVSHALANTIKRVAVIALSVVVFQTKITLMGKIGSTIAIAGALVYSLVGKKSKSNSKTTK